MTKSFSYLILLVGLVAHAAAVDVCGCFCASSASATPSWSNLVGGFVTTGGASACSPTICNNNFQANTQCAANSYPYVLSQFAPGVVPDAVLQLTAVSNCAVGSTPITLTGTDCNSQCLAGFDFGADGNVGILLPSYTGSSCTCAVAELVSTTTGTGTGVIITPSATDANINVNWAYTGTSSSGTYVMTTGSCTLTYALTAVGTSSSASLIKPAAGLIVAGIAALYL